MTDSALCCPHCGQVWPCETMRSYANWREGTGVSERLIALGYIVDAGNGLTDKESRDVLDEVIRLQNELREARAVLERVEWAACMGCGGEIIEPECCPACNGLPREGHAAGCALVKTLGRTATEGQG